MQNVRFKHLRNYTYLGTWQQFLDGDDRMVPHNFGGITLAFVDKEDGTFSVGMAVCSVGDNFCRATGRHYATKRLETNPVTVSSEEMNALLAANEVEEIRDYDYAWSILEAVGKAQKANPTLAYW